MIKTLWKKYQRQIDKEILWPICKEKASCIADARGAFYVHAMIDPAYSDLTEDQIIALIEEFE